MINALHLSPALARLRLLMFDIRLGGNEAAFNVLGVNDLLATSVLVAVGLADAGGLESEVGRQKASVPSTV